MGSPSNYTTTVQTCLYFCNTPKNQSTGYCPNTCLPICPSICHFTFPILLSPPYPNYPHRNLSPILISMLTVLASAFLLITFYVLYIKLYSQFYHQTRPNPRPVLDRDHGDHPPPLIFHPVWYIPTVGLSADEIDAIEVRKYGKGEELGGAVECTVCLAEFEEKEELRVLGKCNHAFHIDCIDTWLKSHTSCPLCRGPVVAPECDPTVENAATPSLTVGSAAEDSSPAEVRINVNNNNNNNNNKEKSSGSTSQRWRSEREAANLMSRSFSCGANIFSSRYNNNNNNV